MKTPTLVRAALAAAVCALASLSSAAATTTTHAHIHLHHHRHHHDAAHVEHPEPHTQPLKHVFHVQTRKSLFDQALKYVADDRSATLDIWRVQAVADAHGDDPVLDAKIYATPASMQAFERASAGKHMRVSKPNHKQRPSKSVTVDSSNTSASDWLLNIDDEDRTERERIETDRREVAACLNRTTGFLDVLQRAPSSARYTDSAFFDCFRPHDQVFAFLDALAAQNSGVFTKLANISTTLEGRAIPAYRLSTTPASATGATKRVLYTQALIHAREWQAGASTFYTIAHLLDELRRGSAAVRALLDQFDWYFVPIVNIDGYIYSATVDRYWRTNRRVVDSNGSAIDGVDLNRNFGPDKYFNLKPEENDAETNPGEAPLSEPSTAGIVRFLMSLKHLSGIVDMHSFGGQVLRPFSNHAGNPPEPFGSQLKKLGDGVAASISKHTRVAYESETGAYLYEAFGCFDDGMYLTFNYTVPAITIEVEGDDFIAPQSSIRAVGKSIYYGLVRFAHEVSAYRNVTAHRSDK